MLKRYMTAHCDFNQATQAVIADLAEGPIDEEERKRRKLDREAEQWLVSESHMKHTVPYTI